MDFDHLKAYAYRGKFLSNWNQRMLREDDQHKGLFDNDIVDILNTYGVEYVESKQYRSIYSYEKLEAALSSFDKKPDDFRTKLTSGLRHARRKFAAKNNTQKLKALRLDSPTLIKDAKIKDKSAGLTSFGKSKFEAWTEGVRYANLILRQHKTPKPAIAQTRTQKKLKTRLVWAYPLEMTIIESLIARPIITEFLSRTDIPMAFGEYSLATANKFVGWANSTNYITGIDYSQFDSSVKRSHIRFAFDVLRSYFDLNQEVAEGITVRQIFNQVEYYFINTPLVFPSERGASLILGKTEGVPSGSYFTQVIDSIVNYAIITDVYDEMKVSYDPDKILVLGDDMISFTSSKPDKQTVSQLISERGYTAHPEKGSQGTVTEEFDFLGRVWIKFKPTRTFQDIADHALYPERFRKRTPENRMLDASRVVKSYGLTAYVMDTNFDRGDIFVTENMGSGLTSYYVSEGIYLQGMQKMAIM